MIAKNVLIMAKTNTNAYARTEITLHNDYTIYKHAFRKKIFDIKMSRSLGTENLEILQNHVLIDQNHFQEDLNHLQTVQDLTQDHIILEIILDHILVHEMINMLDNELIIILVPEIEISLILILLRRKHL